MDRPRLVLGSDQENGTVLRMVSELRALFQKLPHLPTPRERAELDEFRRYRKASGPIREPRLSVIRAGFRAAWCAGDLQAIRDVAANLTPGVLREDLDIQMFATLAAQRAGERRDGTTDIRPCRRDTCRETPDPS